MEHLMLNVHTIFLGLVEKPRTPIIFCQFMILKKRVQLDGLGNACVFATVTFTLERLYYTFF